MFNKCFFAFFVLLSLISCQKEKPLSNIEADFLIDFENSSQLGLINSSSISDEKSYDGKFSTLVNKESNFGGGWQGSFPDSLSGKTIRVILSAFIYADSLARPVIAFSLDKEGQNFYWHSLSLNDSLCDNKWHQVIDTFLIPGDFTAKYCNVKTFLWLSNGTGKAYADNISLQFRKAHFNSFLPNLNYDSNAIGKSLNFKSAEVKFNSTNELLSLSLNKVSLFKSIRLLTEWCNENNRDTGVLFSNLSFVKTFNDTMYFESDNELIKSNISLVINDSTLVFNSSVNFKLNTNLKRLALVFEFENKANKLLSNDGFWMDNVEDEYWIGNGALAFSHASGNWITQNNSNFTSLQVQNNFAVFNLDYSIDHPLIHFPLRKDAKRGVYEDRSCSKVLKNESMKAELTFQKINNATKVPTLSKFPNGFESAYIFTEHADYTDLRTHLAVCFGNDSAINLKNCKEGFVGNNIPVTKSIFYSNEDKVNNSESLLDFNTPIASWKENLEFRKLIDELYKMNWDIALHTPDHYTTSAATMTEALGRFKEKYNSSTWIDHGYDNGPADNREDLMCDALVTGSKNYSLALWQEFGVSNVWNSWYEDQKEIKVLGFDQHLQINYPFLNTSCPKPLLFKHKSLSANITHWLSNSIVDYDSPQWWSYYFNKNVLDRLCINKGIVINHCYPARVKEKQFFWIKEGNVFKIHPEFEKILKLLNEYQSANLIWLCTVKELISFKERLESVGLSYFKNSVRVTNKGLKDIEGLTLVIPSEIALNYKEGFSQRKTMTGETMLIFNLKAGQTISFNYK